MPTPPRSRSAFVTPLVAAALLLGSAACGGPIQPPTTGSGPTVPVASAGAGPASSSAPGPTSTPSAPSADGDTASATPEKTELPRGGRTVFPRFRLVGYAGRTGSTTLGRLGTGDLDQRVGELERRAEPYALDGREVLPVLEVIATTVQASPGRDGRYRTRMSDAQVERYLDVAREHRALLLLAIQPGRADFLTEVEAYDRWLAEPDVGVALDPEWAMGADQVPGRAFGHSTGAELDAVAAHLSSVTREHDLPEKVFVFHELAARIVTGEGSLHPHPGVVQIKSVDGIGSAAAKRSTYRSVNEGSPKGVLPGFKLFYDEDRREGDPLMTPAQVLALEPRPVYVMHE